MRGEAPIQLRETHKGKRQRTEATLKICSQDKDRVSVSDPLQNKLIFQHRHLPVGTENMAREKNSRKEVRFFFFFVKGATETGF